MRQNRRRQCVAVASVLMMLFSSGLSRAHSPDSVPRNHLVLPELIQEVLAKNPELLAARNNVSSVSEHLQIIFVKLLVFDSLFPLSMSATFFLSVFQIKEKK